MHTLKQVIKLLTTPYYGSNRVSRFLRPYLEKVSVKKLFAVPLAGAAIFSAIIIPEADALLSSYRASTMPNSTIVEVVPTESKYQWPLSTFQLTQYFSSFHPGIDMADPSGVPIYPIAGGTVSWINHFPVGYGNHLLITHADGTKSLYAHLSTIIVQKDQTVTKATQLGAVGSTGWSTGNHLHLEIYEKEAAINPLEVLPDLTYSNK